MPGATVSCLPRHRLRRRRVAPQIKRRRIVASAWVLILIPYRGGGRSRGVGRGLGVALGVAVGVGVGVAVGVEVGVTVGVAVG